MAEFTWGDLPKSQVDNELITEAITAAILAHEEDPTSHLGAGESLEQHKINGVIDHPAVSIVPDKINGFQKFNYPVLMASTVDTPDLGTISASPISFQFRQNTSFSGLGSVYLFNVNPESEGWVDGDVIVDFKLVLSGTAGTCQGRLDLGFAGVELKNGYYRLRYYRTGWQVSSWIAESLAWNKHFRVHYDSITEYIYFYLNDELVYSVAGVCEFESASMDWFLILDRGTSTDSKMWLENSAYYLAS